MIFHLSVKAKNEKKIKCSAQQGSRKLTVTVVSHFMPTAAQENNAEINTANIFTQRVLFKSFLKVQDWQHLLNSTMYIYFAELK